MEEGLVMYCTCYSAANICSIFFHRHPVGGLVCDCSDDYRLHKTTSVNDGFSGKFMLIPSLITIQWCDSLTASVTYRDKMISELGDKALIS